MRVIRLLIILISLLITPYFVFSQDTIHSDTTSKKVKIVEDDAVLSMLDSLATLKVFSDGSSPHELKYPAWSNYTETDIPYFSDSVYAARIAVMNENSPFEYVYNWEVKKFIELYAVRKRKLTARILGLSEIYFPLFEEQLDRFNMPLELKYLAVIESALNPIANSKAGAKGLWQFMYGTGKVYGLKVSSYVDDRYDPFKATIAACEHLQDLYDIYGNWSLALAAYNSGAGNVNKAIRRSGGLKNFWAIHKYLPKETRSYVPAFIAASYVLAYANEHKIYPVDPGILYYEVDTVTVKHPLTFDQLSEMLNIPWDEISFLNPAYKKGVIPATPEVPYKLRLRKKYIADFINNENTIYAYKTRKALSEDASLAAIYASYRETQQYTVKKGETMASIAKKFHMSIPELKSLNNIKKNAVKPKQKIFVYVPGSAPKIPDSILHKQEITAKSDSVKTAFVKKDTIKPLATEPEPETGAPKIHVVKSGESLGLIAGKYNVTVNELMSWNNLSSSKVIVGQKIKIKGSNQKTIASAGSDPKPQSSKPETKQAPGNARFLYYTIQPGDNLWDLADHFSVTVAQIKNLNDIKNASYLKPGQKIKIPK
ncbi:MAG: LysM peptidoglycan-binding domain-containing protein [Bacteroidetes bacterium]|nr:LysM peptidoglycan-binding domain-containing protein [Bacteroidota bacterium]